MTAQGTNEIVKTRDPIGRLPAAVTLYPRLSQIVSSSASFAIKAAIKDFIRRDVLICFNRWLTNSSKTSSPCEAPGKDVGIKPLDVPYIKSIKGRRDGAIAKTMNLRVVR
jgi:hypothetical protein